MNFQALSTLVHDKETAVRFLRSHGVIHQQRVCNNGHPMTLSTTSDDRWRCFARHCRQEIGARKGTCLERTKMEFRTVILFIYCWSKNLATIKFCSEELSIGQATVIEWKNFLREICALRLLQTPKMVGGPGLHVEIDETLIFGRKNQARSAAKLEAGTASGRSLPSHQPPQWLIGGVCLDTREVFLHAAAVPGRTAASLVEAIEGCIAPGSVIVSDLWASYPGIETMLDKKNYTCQTVSHNERVDRKTGTQHALPQSTIEPFWHVEKMDNKRQCGTQLQPLLDSFFCEFLWRQRNLNSKDLFIQFLNDISRVYPLPSSPPVVRTPDSSVTIDNYTTTPTKHGRPSVAVTSSSSAVIDQKFQLLPAAVSGESIEMNESQTVSTSVDLSPIERVVRQCMSEDHERSEPLLSMITDTNGHLGSSTVQVKRESNDGQPNEHHSDLMDTLESCQTGSVPQHVSVNRRKRSLRNPIHRPQKKRNQTTGFSNRISCLNPQLSPKLTRSAEVSATDRPTTDQTFDSQHEVATGSVNSSSTMLSNCSSQSKKRSPCVIRRSSCCCSQMARVLSKLEKFMEEEAKQRREEFKQNQLLLKYLLNSMKTQV